MIRKERVRLTIVLAALGLLSIVCANIEGGGSTNPLTAMISEFSGKVQVLKASEGQFRPATAETQLEVSDQVLTGEDGRARIDISDGTIIRLSPLSNFVLTAVENTEQGSRTRLQLNIGRLWIILNGGVVEVDTPSGLASVRGSYLHVWVDPLTEETNITCLEGECALGNELGAVSLVAGQTARITGAGKAPEAGKMTHEDVREWLNSNPEATLVVVPLTATVAAGEDQPLPEVKTNTPTPTKTQGPSPTTEPSKTPTKTLVDVDCGPPLGWVLHTVRAGESLTTLSELYRVSESELRKANCRGDMSFVVTGEKLFVPNVATSTPTKTPTITPTKTPLVTSGGGGSSTGTVTPGTPTPTNSPTTFSGPVGPDNKTITTTAMCPNSYRIEAKDADGIADVKMIYTFDGSLPMRDTAISDGYYKILTKVSGDLYSVSNYMIDTTGEATPVNIRFRFAVKDSAGNVSYFPAGDAYDLTDKINCAGDTPATFTNEAGPAGTTISSPTACSQTFQIDITDPDGIAEVKLLYNVDGTTPTWSSAVAAGDYYSMSNSGGDTYAVTEVIDSSVGSTNVVKYVYAVKDSLGNITESSLYTYTDTVDCGETTTTSTTTPSGNTITDLGFCGQDYTIIVTDANGIGAVKLTYTITDGSTTSSPAEITMPMITTDTYGLTGQSIDTTAFTTPPPNLTINFDFVVIDGNGNSSIQYSGSFSDTVGCGP